MNEPAEPHCHAFAAPLDSGAIRLPWAAKAWHPAREKKQSLGRNDRDAPRSKSGASREKKQSLGRNDRDAPRSKSEQVRGIEVKIIRA
jgi:hypothetical protein